MGLLFCYLPGYVRQATDCALWNMGALKGRSGNSRNDAMRSTVMSETQRGHSQAKENIHWHYNILAPMLSYQTTALATTVKLEDTSTYPTGSFQCSLNWMPLGQVYPGMHTEVRVVISKIVQQSCRLSFDIRCISEDAEQIVHGTAHWCRTGAAPSPRRSISSENMPLRLSSPQIDPLLTL